MSLTESDLGEDARLPDGSIVTIVEISADGHRAHVEDAGGTDLGWVSAERLDVIRTEDVQDDLPDEDEDGFPDVL